MQMGPSPYYSSDFRRDAAFCALVVAWLLPGLVGHDPWKPDEAYTFGLIFHIRETGDWLVPTLAGEPFVEKPPLYFWTRSSPIRSAG